MTVKAKAVSSLMLLQKRRSLDSLVFRLRGVLTVSKFDRSKHSAVVENGCYQSPTEPGYSVEMKEESMETYSFPGKERGFWRSEEASPILEGVTW